jgi:very-short-patch-repair endonuclease
MSVTRARTLRQASTEAERRLWSCLRDRQLDDWKFRRQVPIESYVADFACREAWLVVELDGGQHTTEDDAARTRALEEAGWRVLRFWNDEVLRTTDGVRQVILMALAEAAAWRRGVRGG